LEDFEKEVEDNRQFEIMKEKAGIISRVRGSSINISSLVVLRSPLSCFRGRGALKTMLG